MAKTRDVVSPLVRMEQGHVDVGQRDMVSEPAEGHTGRNSKGVDGERVAGEPETGKVQTLSGELRTSSSDAGGICLGKTKGCLM